MTAFVLLVEPPGAQAAIEVVAPLLEPVAYLGPQGRTLWSEDNLALGVLLFSVAQEAIRERQPRFGGDGRYVLAADVRLDDRPGLIRSLPVLAGVDANSTDSEMLLAAYLTWGQECVRHLCGDYAFVVFDRRNQILFAAADPLGIRRLFYLDRPGGGFLIASDEAFLLALEDLDLFWDPFAVACRLMGRAHRDLSLFRPIRVLARGSRLTRTNGRLKTGRWWSPNPKVEIRYRDPRDYVEHYVEVMRAAVVDRLRSATGVVATELSGGIDSSSIAALAAPLLSARGGRLLALSRRFPMAPQCDEGARIEASVARLGIDHINIDAGALTQEHYPLGYCVRRESPQALANPVFDAELEAAKGQGADVLLTGIGGDEVLLGAPEFVYAERLLRGEIGVIQELLCFARRHGRSPWAVLRALLLVPALRLASGPGLRWIRRRRTRQWLPPWVELSSEARRAVEAHLFEPSPPIFREPSRQVLWERLWSATSAPEVDGYRMAGARLGLDVRFPFHDLRLAEFALSIPSGLWHRDGMTKWLARTAIASMLPPEVTWGFNEADCGSVFGEAAALRERAVAELLERHATDIPGLRAADILGTALRETAHRSGRFRAEALFALDLVVYRDLGGRAPGNHQREPR